MISVWDNGFLGKGVLMQRRKTGREMERGNGFSYFMLSYVFKSAVELELFSNILNIIFSNSSTFIKNPQFPDF